MALPDTRDVDFGALTDVPSGTLNSLQDMAVDAWEYGSAGKDHFLDIAHDFPGSAYPTDLLLAAAGGGTGTIIDDAAAGGCGALSINNGNADCICETVPMNLGTKDFRLSFIARPLTLHVANFFLGIASATAAEEVWFQSIINGNWYAKVGAAAAVDTGVAAGTTYKLFTIKRVSNVLKFYVDSVEKYSVAFATAIAAGKVHMRDQSTGTVGSLIVDKFRLRAKR